MFLQNILNCPKLASCLMAYWVHMLKSRELFRRVQSYNCLFCYQPAHCKSSSHGYKISTLYSSNPRFPFYFDKDEPEITQYDVSIKCPLDHLWHHNLGGLLKWRVLGPSQTQRTKISWVLSITQYSVEFRTLYTWAYWVTLRIQDIWEPLFAGHRPDGHLQKRVWLNCCLIEFAMHRPNLN